MYETMFVFAGRNVRVRHVCLLDAKSYAAHVLRSWRGVKVVQITEEGGDIAFLAIRHKNNDTTERATASLADALERDTSCL